MGLQRVGCDWATFPFTDPVRPVSLQEGEVRTQRQKEGHMGTQRADGRLLAEQEA